MGTTIVYDDIAARIDAAKVEAGALLIPVADVRRATRFEVKTVGACRDALDDERHATWYFGFRSDQRSGFASLQAPDFSLPDIHGHSHSLLECAARKSSSSHGRHGEVAALTCRSGKFCTRNSKQRISRSSRSRKTHAGWPMPVPGLPPLRRRTRRLLTSDISSRSSFRDFGGRDPSSPVIDLSLGILFGSLGQKVGLAPDDHKKTQCLTSDNVQASDRGVTKTFPYIGPAI